MRLPHWSENFCDFWIVESSPHSIAPEVVRLFVGLGIEQHIVVSGKPELEVALSPQLLVDTTSLLGSVGESRTRDEIEREAGEAIFTVSKQFGIGLARKCLGGQVVLDLLHGESHVWGSLEDGEMASHLTELCGELDASRTCAYDSNPLACKINPFVRPV